MALNMVVKEERMVGIKLLPLILEFTIRKKRKKDSRL